MGKRALFNPHSLPSSTLSGAEGPPQKAEALREAYKKHSSELVAIEDQQGKLLLVMLGIFSAGATFLASKADAADKLTPLVRVSLTLIVLALLYLWIWFTLERNNYRQAVRDLLIRCELALGFYAEGGPYLQGGALYTMEELEFASKGGFMAYTQLFVVGLAGLGFLLILWSKYI